MLKAEQLGSYSRHNDYYQLWVEKKKENQKLIGHLLDSKKVITTLHLKLSDILNYIKIFEVNQENVNYNTQETEASDGSYLYVPVDDQNIVPEHNQMPILPESRSEFVEMVCDHDIAEENSSPIPQLQCETILSAPLPSELVFKPNETEGRTKQRGRRKRSFVSEENLHMPTDVQMANIPYAVTEPIEAHEAMESHKNRQTNYVESYSEETEPSSTEKPDQCDNLALTILGCVKTEPVDVEEEDVCHLDNVPDIVLPTHSLTQSVPETTVQLYEKPSGSLRKRSLRTRNHPRKMWQEASSDEEEHLTMEPSFDPDFIVSDGQSSSYTNPRIAAITDSSVWDPDMAVLPSNSAISIKSEALGGPSNENESMVQDDGRKNLKGPMWKCKIRVGGVRRRNILTMEEKLKGLMRLDNGETQRKVAADLRVGEATVRNWIRDRAKIEQNLSNSTELFDSSGMNPYEYIKLDEALFFWFTDMCEKGQPPNATVLSEKARRINEDLHGDVSFLASKDWLDRWKKRHNIWL